MIKEEKNQKYISRSRQNAEHLRKLKRTQDVMLQKLRRQQIEPSKMSSKELVREYENLWYLTETRFMTPELRNRWLEVRDEFIFRNRMVEEAA